MRPWLGYSKTKRMYVLFCLSCFLTRKSLLITDELPDQMCIMRTIENHEDSTEHKKSIFILGFIQVHQLQMPLC